MSVYRADDMFRPDGGLFLVVEKGAGFKVAKSGIYVATYEDGGTMNVRTLPFSKIAL